MAFIGGGASEDDEFWVTLPSNTKTHSATGNRPANYTVRLRKPIDLAARGGEWEVALLSTQYTRNWYNFREDCCIRFLVKLPGGLQAAQSSSLSSNSDGGESTSNSRTRAIAQDTSSASEAANAPDLFYRDGEYSWHFDDYTATDNFLLQYMNNNHHGINDSWVYYKIVVRRAYFANVSALGREISRQFARAFAKHDVHLHFHLDYDTGLASFSTTRAKVAVFIENKYLATILGMATEKIFEKVYDREEPATTHILHLMTVNGTSKARLDVVNSLYVYSDIAKFQLVGDTEAPLLGIVPAQGEPGQRVQWNFNPICYLPVNRMFISEIEMLLCTDDGEKVPFAGDSDNVVCCLRFRKTRRTRNMLA